MTVCSNLPPRAKASRRLLWPALPHTLMLSKEPGFHLDCGPSLALIEGRARNISMARSEVNPGGKLATYAEATERATVAPRIAGGELARIE